MMKKIILIKNSIYFFKILLINLQKSVIQCVKSLLNFIVSLCLYKTHFGFKQRLFITSLILLLAFYGMDTKNIVSYSDPNISTTKFKNVYIATLPVSYKKNAKINKFFLAKVYKVAEELLIYPENLIAVMGYETGGAFSSTVTNQYSQAVGLIQFTEKTANYYGTTTKKLSEMTEIQQLDYVKKYLYRFKGNIKKLDDLYMAIFCPAAVGKSKNHILYRHGGKAYWQNRYLDIVLGNADGVITKNEAVAPVRKFLTPILG